MGAGAHHARSIPTEGNGKKAHNTTNVRRRGSDGRRAAEEQNEEHRKIRSYEEQVRRSRGGRHVAANTCARSV